MKTVNSRSFDNQSPDAAAVRALGIAPLMSRVIITGLLALAVAACDSGGTSSSGGDPNEATKCVTRSLGTVYVNECEYDVHVILLEEDAKYFRVKADNASTRTISKRKFGACRVPSIPLLNSDADGFRCSRI